MIRALSINWPQDEKAVAAKTHTCGATISWWRPCTRKTRPRASIYLPAGEWWDYWTGTKFQGGQTVSRPVDLETMPLYVKAGAIVPMGPVKQFTSEPPLSPSHFASILARTADSPGTTTMARATNMRRGEFMRIDCAWKDSERTLTLTPDPAGHRPLPPTVHVQIAGTNQSSLVNLKRSSITVKL